MKKTIHDIAVFVNGSVVGDGNVLIGHIRPIDEADKGDLTFIANTKYLHMLPSTRADVILVTPGTEAPEKNLIVVEDPYAALGKLLPLFYPAEEESGSTSKNAFIDDDAFVSSDTTVYPGVTICRGANIASNVVLYSGVFIGRDVSIGEGTILYPNVSVYRQCRIGKRVIIHAGAVIGSDGFGFANPGIDNVKIPQVGIVQIDDDVEIGANTTIDRGTLGKTWIQRGAKIDNLVQIAHNVIVGENSIIVSQVGISGSTKLGKSVIIGGQTGLVGHISIGDHVMIGAKSGVHDDIPDGQTVSGIPHLPHKEWLRVVSCLAKLPEMRTALKHISEKVTILEKERIK